MIQIVPSVGRSGGLAMVWNSSRISVSILEVDRQYFHLQCQIPQIEPFLLTSVYVLPHSNFRSVLWGNLMRLSAGINGP